jgi:hypothetical protein
MADVQAISDAIGAKLPLILPTLATLFAVLLLQNFLTRKPLANIPVVGQALGNDEKRRQAYLSNAAGLYLEGYQKVGRLAKRQRVQVDETDESHSSKTVFSGSSR